MMLSDGHLRAALTDAEGNVLTGRNVFWSSSSTAVASVNSTGVVTGLTLGVTTITATSEAKSTTALVHVIPKVTVSPRLPSLFAGDTTLLSAGLLTATGTPAGTAPVTWSAAGSSSGSVDANGVVTATTPGTIHVTASAAGGTGSVEVVVIKRPGSANRKVAWRLNDAVHLTGGGTYSELWVSDADGSNAVRVSPLDEHINAYSWSPNGDRLLLEALNWNGGGHNTMYVVSPTGTVLVDLGHWGTRSNWSPDGTQIVFTNNDDLHIINADGTGFRPLRVATGESNLAPQWSPDGRSIAYRRQTTFCNGISVVDADGSNNRALTIPNGACEVLWSPDGKELFFDSWVAPATPTGVLAVRLSAGAARGISPNCVPGPACTGPSVYLSQWLSNGYRLVERSSGGLFSIYDARTGSTASLAAAPADAYVYQWSPDMAKVIFAAVDGIQPRIGVMNADFTAPQFISPVGRQAGEGQWQPAP